MTDLVPRYLVPGRAVEVKLVDERVLRRPDDGVTVIDGLAAGIAFAQGRMIERRILGGIDTLEVVDVDGTRVRYLVPPWRRRPLFRVRLALARRRYARASRR